MVLQNQIRISWAGHKQATKNPIGTLKRIKEELKFKDMKQRRGMCILKYEHLNNYGHLLEGLLPVNLLPLEDLNMPVSKWNNKSLMQMGKLMNKAI